MEKFFTADILTGIIGSALLFVIAIFKKTLTLEATITASLMIMCICICTGGFEVIFLLISYFVLVVIDIAGKTAIDKKVGDTHDKTGARRVSQVLANGFFAVCATILYAVTDNVSFRILYFICVSEACADSIASDIGVLSSSKPVSILTFKRIETGISGGVSPLGLFSSFAGCLFMALLALLAVPFSLKSFVVLLLVPYLGVMLDSILGAAIQVKRRCKICGKPTEKVMHCNEKTCYAGGLKFVSNSVVNILSNLCTGVIGYIILEFT